MSALFDLSGKVAVVTGAALGIGKAIAVGLAEHGADLVVCDLDEPALAGSVAAIEAHGRAAASMRADIGHPDEIAALFALADRAFGRVDILVNNVGTVVRARPEELTIEGLEHVFRIGVTGSLLCAQEAHRRMVAAGTGGSIINISSIAGASALGRGNLSHSMNKGAVNMMTKEMAVEWAKHGIRVNAILPCQVLTEGFQKWLDSPSFDPALYDRFLTGIPMNRLALAADMVGPAVFLASDAAAMVTGALLPVDGGNLALNAGGSHTWHTAQSRKSGGMLNGRSRQERFDMAEYDTESADLAEIPGSRRGVFSRNALGVTAGLRPNSSSICATPTPLSKDTT